MSKLQKTKKIALFLLEYLIGAGIIYWLFQRDVLDIAPLRTIPLALFAGGLGITMAMVWLASIRVRILLRDQGIHLSVRRCFLFNCLGIFYSIFLPGGFSGDAARAYYLLREIPHNRAALVGSLILDRVLGLLAMIGLGTASTAYLVFSVPWLLPYFIGLCVAFAVGLGFVGFLLLTDLKPRNRGSNFLIRLYEMLHNLVVRLNLSGHSRKTLAYAVGLSIAIHSMSIFLIYLCSTHNNSGLGLLGVFSVGPFGLLANAIPISPGGLGVGEQSFEFLYKLVGARNGASSFLTARLFLYSPAVIGAGVAAIFFLRLQRFMKLRKSR
jgi:hypothetical protein